MSLSETIDLYRFIQQGDKVYRANEIWRSVIDRQTGMQLHEERLIDNFAEVKYPVDLLRGGQRG